MVIMINFYNMCNIGKNAFEIMKVLYYHMAMFHICRTNESISEIEDRAKALEDKLRASEINSEEWQDKFKDAKENIYQLNDQIKKLGNEKSKLQTDFDEINW